MSLFNDASLVMIPSGYKEDTVYSVKPTDGSGDLTFTRASDGTRVNSDGLVERVPWNLLKYSEQFDNGAWGKIAGTTVTANQATAPDGTFTADLITEGSSTLVYFTTTFSAGTYTQSYFAKKGTGDIFGMYFNSGFTATFNLTSGTIVSTNNTTATIEDYGNGWYRCSATASPTTNFYAGITYANSSGLTIYAWGAQLVEGSTAKPYFPTTDRLNVPRLDYSNGCPSLLLEPQRTNLVRYSEQFDNASWVKPLGWTITANATTSPDGNTNADLVTPTNFNNLSQSSNVVASTDYTVSVYVKKETTNFSWVSLVFSGGTSINYGYVINWSTLTISLIPARTSAINPTFENVGNGWYRISFVCASGNNTSASFQIIPDTQAGTASIYLWGAQLEQGSYATSYIPTTSASVTRVADAASKTGISSLIGQTEGTIFIDVDLDVRQTFTYFAIAPNLGSTSTYIGFGFIATTIVYEVVNSGIQCSIIYNNSATGRFKIAGAYKANDFVFYVNGSQIGTDTSGTVPNCSQIGLFNYNQTQPLKYNQAALFPTRLTNAELAALTTL